MRQFATLCDTALVQLFANGHEQAFRELYSRHHQHLYRTIVYYVRDPVLAEDITQDVFIKIIHSIKKGRYNEEGKFAAWAARIAHNHCMDYLRKPKRKLAPAGVSDDVQSQFVASHENRLVAEQTATLLYGFIDKLPEEQKKVVLYRHFEERSFKEIARLTNTSVNTSLGRMRYALMHLRNMTKTHPAFR